MKVAFLYPAAWPYEALTNWVYALSRHAIRHEVRLLRQATDVLGFDVVLLPTARDLFPRALADWCIAFLRERQVPFGIIHNNDAVPTPGEYPSFCWTEQGMEASAAYQPWLLRMPVFPCLAQPAHRLQGLHVVTFGHVEPKKQTLLLGQWCRDREIPFTAYCPDVLSGRYEGYHAICKQSGIRIVVHPWQERVESLSPLLESASHFLFSLPSSRAGAGGSPTSPRYAGFFNRPVIVIDDEETYSPDRFYVYRSLGDIATADLAYMEPPRYDWSPDAYLDAVCAGVLDYWRAR